MFRPVSWCNITSKLHPEDTEQWQTTLASAMNQVETDAGSAHFRPLLTSNSKRWPSRHSCSQWPPLFTELLSAAENIISQCRTADSQNTKPFLKHWKCSRSKCIMQIGARADTENRKETKSTGRKQINYFSKEMNSGNGQVSSLHEHFIFLSHSKHTFRTTPKKNKGKSLTGWERKFSQTTARSHLHTGNKLRSDNDKVGCKNKETHLPPARKIALLSFPSKLTLQCK